ncbi:MAG: 50S ribosomal protein L3 [Candidatus Dormibacteria bacterium]
MTQIFNEQGLAVPVTVLEAGPCTVVGLRTTAKDGYTATRIGYGAVTAKHVTKPVAGEYKKAGLTPLRKIVEVRGDSGLEVGVDLKADVFAAGDTVAVTGTSKGKGFQGVVKRHRFGRGPVTHGSHNIRQPGSVGSVDAARTWKGVKMAGQMGNERVTTRGLTVVRVDPERNLLMVRGAVPGPKNAVVLVHENTGHDKTGAA